MNILVTGCFGYLGCRVVRKLLDDGHSVYGIDDCRYGLDHAVHLVFHQNFMFRRLDAGALDKFRDWIELADVFIPLAAIVGAPLCEKMPEETWRVNFHCVAKTLDLLRIDCKVIYPNTNSGYGTTTGEQYLVETDILAPISEYGRSKVAVEDLLTNHNACVFRLATVFGGSPRMRLDLLINNFVYEAITKGHLVIYEGHFLRNYLYIGDFARVVCYALDKWEVFQKQVFNLGSDSLNFSKLKLAQQIAGYVGNVQIIEAPIGSDPDQRNYKISNNKLISTGFRPTNELETGVRELQKAIECKPVDVWRNY